MKWAFLQNHVIAFLVQRNRKRWKRCFISVAEVLFRENRCVVFLVLKVYSLEATSQCIAGINTNQSGSILCTKHANWDEGGASLGGGYVVKTASLRCRGMEDREPWPWDNTPIHKKRSTVACSFAVKSSGWGDSNARPLRPERSALPTALHPD